MVIWDTTGFSLPLSCDFAVLFVALLVSFLAAFFTGLLDLVDATGSSEALDLADFVDEFTFSSSLFWVSDVFFLADVVSGGGKSFGDCACSRIMSRTGLSVRREINAACR